MLFDIELLHSIVVFLLSTGAMGSFTSANLCRCVRYFKACLLVTQVFKVPVIKWLENVGILMKLADMFTLKNCKCVHLICKL